MLVRTVKSCGPDASTLASSLAEAKSARPGADQPYPKDDGDNKARSPGRSRSKPLDHCAGNARWQKVYINQCNLVGVSLFVSRSAVAIICCAKIHMGICYTIRMPLRTRRALDLSHLSGWARLVQCPVALPLG